MSEGRWIQIPRIPLWPRAWVYVYIFSFRMISFFVVVKRGNRLGKSIIETGGAFHCTPKRPRSDRQPRLSTTIEGWTRPRFRFVAVRAADCGICVRTLRVVIAVLHIIPRPRRRRRSPHEINTSEKANNRNGNEPRR